MTALTKKRTRTSVGALIVALLVIPLMATPSTAATTGFRDVTGNYQFYREISWLTAEGITTGYADKSFRPESAVTREAFAAFLYRLAGSPSVSLPSSSPFKDVKKGDQFYRQIVWLDKQNIANGWSDGTYRPKLNISRSAMSAFLYRYKDQPSYTAPKKSRFKDMKTSSKFYKEVSWMAQSGMTTGFSDGTFRPYDSTSRAATAAFLFRGYGKSSYKAPKYVAPKVSWKPNEIKAVAKSQVGYREKSWRTNKYNDWIGGNSAWCSVYVGWVFEKAGYPGYVPKAKYFDTRYSSKIKASDTYVGKLEKAGVLDWNVSLSDLKPGKVVLMNWRLGDGASHTAIVDRVSGNGAWFYEGNTTDGTGNKGRGVFHRYRSLRYIDAVYDPRDYYDATH